MFFHTSSKKCNYFDSDPFSPNLEITILHRSFYQPTDTPTDLATNRQNYMLAVLYLINCCVHVHSRDSCAIPLLMLYHLLICYSLNNFHLSDNLLTKKNPFVWTTKSILQEKENVIFLLLYLLAKYDIIWLDFTV